MKFCNLSMTAILPFLLLLETTIAFTTRAIVGHGWSFAPHGIRVMNGNENDNFDMEELNQRMADESNPYAKLFLTNGWEYRPKPNDVHIILFKPDTDDEGVHTIEYPIGSGNNMILAFESSQECDTFAAMLKSQQFFDPSVRVIVFWVFIRFFFRIRSHLFTLNTVERQPQTMNLNDLEAYCEQLGVLVKVVPRETYLIPPEARVEQLDHNPLLRTQKDHLDYLMALNNDLDSEPFASSTMTQKSGGSWE